MGIRRRISPPITRGVPAPKFRGYTQRFGHTAAEFDNAGMQRVSGTAPDVHRQERATILFMSRDHLKRWIAERIEQGILNDATDELIAIENDWPD